MLEEVTLRRLWIGSLFIVIFLLIGPLAAIDYETSWVGNKWGGGPRDPWFDNDSDWIQMRIERMGVGKQNGVCIGTCYWDESGRDGGVYDTDARFLVNILHRTPAGPSTANNNYIFAAPGGGEIRRFNYNGDHTGSLPGGVYAMRINPGQNQLYVSGNNEVRIYNPDNLQLYRSFGVSGAGAVAVENNDYFWVAQHNNSVRRYHRDNGDTGTVITGLGDAYEITFNPLTNQLWVFDRRPDQQFFRIYDTSGNRAVDPNIGQDFFGIQGGVYVATTAQQTGTPTVRGEVHPLKFNYVTGCGFDLAGNLYVGSDGPRITKGNEGAGALIRKFDYQGNLVWEAPGLEFIDVADADPDTDGVDVYTKHGHYVVDHSLPPGQDVTYKGFTLDPYRYPDDMRTMEGADNPRLYAPNRNEHIRGISNAMIRRIDGRKIMYVGDQHSTGLLIYRFEDEIAVPAGRMAKTAKPGGEGYYWDSGSGQWLYGSGDVTRWYIWRDLDGDGSRDTNEEDMSEYGDYFDGVWGWYVDHEGTIWTPWKFRGIRRYECQGLDQHGNPIYSQTHDWWPNPQPFGTPYPISDPWYPDRMVTNYQDNAMVCRAMYIPDQDAMIVSGYTLDYPQSMACGGNCEWGITGRAVYRYDNWSTRTDHPIPPGGETWMITLPYDNVTSFPSNDTLAIKSIDISEDYVFTCEFASSKVAVYDIHTGQHQFDLTPGPEVGYNCGWNETPRGMQAFKRSDGQYLVFVSEESEAKVIMYRFQGPNAPDQPRSLMATPVSTSQIDLTWTDTSEIEVGFRIERRNESGSFTEIATVGLVSGSGGSGSYSDTGLPMGTPYWYRVRADLSGGNFSEYSNVANASTLLPPPAAPTNLVAVADVPLAATVNLTWTDNADNESSYIIERANGPVGGHGAFATIATIGPVAGTGSQGDFSDTGLLSQTTYTYRVLAGNSGGNTASNEDDASTPFVPDPVWIDDADPMITYSGNWTAQTGWANRYMNTLHETSDAGASAAFSFSGNSLTLYGDKRDWGSTARIIIDGQTPGESVSFNGVSADGVEIATIDNLACGSHDVQLVADGGGWTYLDAFVYIPCEISGPPEAPGNLVATPASHERIDLTWSDNATNETGFRIERKTTGGFTEIATTPADDADYSDTGLTYETTYTYRVRAFNGQGDSAWSNEDDAITLPPPDPAPPAGLSAQAGNGVVILNWNPNTEIDPLVLYYKLMRSTTPGGPYRIAAIAFGGTNITDKSVYNDTTYYYRISAVDTMAHESAASAEVSATPSPPQPPPPPVLSAEVLPYSEGEMLSIHVYWSYGGNSGDTIEIERKTGPGGSFALLASTTADQAYSDTSVSPDTTFTYRVRAMNTVGYSLYSNEAPVTTPALAIPADPTNLVADAVSISQIDLTWNDNSAIEDGYRIERKTTGDFEQLGAVGENVTAYSDITLYSYTQTYVYRIIAYNAAGDSNDSNEASATILIDPIVTTVDDADASINYSGNWNAQSGWSGRYMQTIHESSDTDATAEFTFTGSRIELLADLQPWGGTIDVYIDDTLELENVTYTGGPDDYQQVIFAIDLPNGLHTVQIRKTGGEWIYVDAFRYTHY